jgi:hypothetical protein
MAITKISSNILASNAVQDNLNAQASISLAKAVSLSGNFSMTGNAIITGNLTVDTNTLFVDSVNDRVGIGTANPSAKLHTVSTTEQLRLGYNASNYMSATVSSAGAVTLDAVGASAGFAFGDPVTATAQPVLSGIGSTHVMTKGLSDAAYAKVYTAVATSDQDVTNSSSLTNSLQCAINIPETGTYLIETSEQVISSDWANAGSKTTLAYSGTVSGGAFAGGQSSGAAASFLNQAFAWNNNWTTTQIVSNPNQSLWVMRQGYATFTTSGSVSIAFAQNTAVSGHYARLQQRSWIKATKI